MEQRALRSVVTVANGQSLAKFVLLRRRVASASMAGTVVDRAPNEKPLRTTSFVIHATRGVIRDQTTRRKVMFGLLAIALVLLFSGSTFLAPIITPREHPGWFIFFWFVCAWLTLTAMLLAIFDLLMVRLQGRKTERTLRQKFSQSETRDWPSGHDGE
jgi:hypothetical protein